MKNLTVNMPLAVPHQKPPSKLASHPYPVFEQDIYRASITPLGGEFRVLRSTLDMQDAVAIGINPLSGVFRNPLFALDINDGGYIASITPLDGEFINNTPIFKDINIIDGGYSAGISPLNGSFRKLLIEHRENDKAYTVSIQPLNGEFKN